MPKLPASCVMQEPEVERREDQDDADVGREPLPHVASEEQDVDPDHDSCRRDRVQHAGCRPSHRATLSAMCGLPGRVKGRKEPRSHEQPKSEPYASCSSVLNSLAEPTNVVSGPG